MKFFSKTIKAEFLSRPNRFIVYCRFRGKRIKAFLPNPGRLQELLIPGIPLYLEGNVNPNRSTSYTAVAVKGRSNPIVLHTHLANEVARRLLEEGRVPGLERAKLIQGEVTKGRSRFDFLLRQGRRDVFLEVKSCTLFSERMAMFPDAITERGKRHVEELAELYGTRSRGVVLFLVHNPRARFFLPDFHTDLEFAKALHEARKKIAILPLAVGWREDLTLDGNVKLLEIPWRIVEQEAEDRGCYLLLLRLKTNRVLEVGKLGRIPFKRGYYIYSGSARANLAKRLSRHRALRKNKFWHIDYLRESSEVHAALPVLTKDDIECEMAEALRKLTGHEVSGFGSSDCACPSHLFWMKEDPLHAPAFHDLLMHFRMERLLHDL